MTQTHLIIVLSEKGGVRKTATTSALAAYLCSASSDVIIYQIDDQSHLPAWHGDQVVTAPLPSDGELRSNDMADVQALTPAINAIVGATHRYILIDVGANADERLLGAFATLEIDEIAAETDRQCSIVVPYSSDVDTINLGWRTVQRSKIAFPQAHIVLVRNEDGGRDKDVSGAAAKTLAELKETATHLITHPRILPRALSAIEASPIAPWHLAEEYRGEVARLLSVDVVTALAVRRDLQVWKADLEDGFETLPFRIAQED